MLLQFAHDSCRHRFLAVIMYGVYFLSQICHLAYNTNTRTFFIITDFSFAILFSLSSLGIPSTHNPYLCSYFICLEDLGFFLFIVLFPIVSSFILSVSVKPSKIFFTLYTVFDFQKFFFILCSIEPCENFTHLAQ